MKPFGLQRRTLAVIAVLAALLVLLAWVALRSGPLAPVAVTEAVVETRALQPALFGIGAVDARHVYRIGPTYAGRVRSLRVEVGDRVAAGDLLGEMDPVDLDQRLRAQQAAASRASALQRDARARHAHAADQARRYEKLRAEKLVSEEMLSTRRQELRSAEAVLAAAEADAQRIASELAALQAQRDNVQLRATVAGIVTRREAEPGSTVVAGQAVVEMIDPGSLWIGVRFDQSSATGLAAGLPARIALRSRAGQPLTGRIERIEPRADAVTEELLAKVVFDELPAPLPPIGELAEVTVQLPALPASPVLPNAALQRQGERIGVWRIDAGKVAFVPVLAGRSDLDGLVQVRAGLAAGAHIVVYSEKALAPGTRVHVVERIPGTGP